MESIYHYFPKIRECVQDFCINLQSVQSLDSNDLLYTHAISEHKKLFLELLLSSSGEEIEKKTAELVHFTIEQEISYLFLYSELVTVARQLLGILADDHDFDHIAAVNRYFTEHENRITALYLQKFLKQLTLKNELRLSHIAMMGDKKFMIHYEYHLQWILSLIRYVQQNEFDDHYPELNPDHCEFGRWLNNATTSYLLSTSHFNVIKKLHVNLHDLAANVITYYKSSEFLPATLIHLMQRIDYYSLEIGNEIAFLNEIEESAKDPLTHLLTRRLFNKIMMNKLDISKATGREFSLLMCDLDHFKVINDTYGHVVGDVVLKHFSGILEQTLRKSDYIFRFGGEEFMVLLPTTSKAEALALAQKICDATEQSELLVEKASIRYTVSIGAISVLIDDTLPIHQDTIDRYIAQVDEKLYLAKERGRNRVE
ncbi:MAG: sensor domain-containing diguanylate cyclase [Sulfuricurvum sp.]|jgi:diguanylate cyclase (GGDEF)-like protein|uniref:sensor domain-containing diguanylate cyclase n=1 Tax=Sulfuricurvum sp. TaxID=2025608 RepID=UPI0025D8F7AB|nr:sensor domain-containing diguanylate cyclase [Sulfuricurvum sp.]MCK9373951.1 sensor domain-containing diguanylate cyclase [Sulfuricurvum sp.]